MKRSEEGHIALTAEQIKYAGISIERVGPASCGRPCHCTGKSCPMRSVSTPCQHVSRGSSARYPNRWVIL